MMLPLQSFSIMRVSPFFIYTSRTTKFFDGGLLAMENEIIVGIGGAAGDGGASTGDNLSLTCTRQGLHVYVYTSYQSLIRGGHSWIRLRISTQKVTNVGDQVSAMIALNQDAMDRH